MFTIPLSVLDLIPVASGSTSTQALENSVELAHLVERLGYTRYWLAEHHGMPGVASSAPEIVIGHIAQATQRMRIGSGGIMLPNHAPLKVAETFRLLEALYPGRIDLGIGRAPGTDGRTAMALRGSRGRPGADGFEEQLGDLLAFAGGTFPPGHPYRSIVAMPNDVPLPPIWLLGSSDYGARMAAAMGAGFAFAHHINPEMVLEAAQIYRELFEPSEALRKPYLILTVTVVCADSDAEAAVLASSLELTFLRLRTGRPGLLPSPEEALSYPYSVAERAMVDASRSRFTVGSPVTVRAKLMELIARTGADELMVTTMVHNHQARLHSYELLAGQFESRSLESHAMTATP